MLCLVLFKILLSTLSLKPWSSLCNMDITAEWQECQVLSCVMSSYFTIALFQTEYIYMIFISICFYCCRENGFGCINNHKLSPIKIQKKVIKISY